MSTAIRIDKRTHARLRRFSNRLAFEMGDERITANRAVDMLLDFHEYSDQLSKMDTDKFDACRFNALRQKVHLEDKMRIERKTKQYVITMDFTGEKAERLSNFGSAEVEIYDNELAFSGKVFSVTHEGAEADYVITTTTDKISDLKQCTEAVVEIYDSKELIYVGKVYTTKLAGTRHEIDIEKLIEANKEDDFKIEGRKST